TTRSEVCRPIIDVARDPVSGVALTNPDGSLQLIYGPAQTISGFRLKDGRASYGLGLETFALGFPIHFDWSWRTAVNKAREDVVFAPNGAAERTSGSQRSPNPRGTR